MNKNWFLKAGIVSGLAVIVVLSALLYQKTTAGNGAQAKSESLEKEESAEGGFSEKAALRLCEHGMAIYLCDECRYEAGVVKISDSLLGEGSNTGLLGLSQVALKKIDAVLEITGEVQLNQNLTAHLGSAVPGILYSVETDIGKRVRKGDVLFTIHSPELGRVVSDYRKNLSLTQLSEKNYTREKSLFESSISSELEVSEKKMEYDRNRAEREAAKQALLAFGLTAAEIDALQDEPEGAYKPGLLKVRAPFDGTVMEKSASRGELIVPGRDVFLLSDLTTVNVTADVYEKDLTRFLDARKNGVIQVKVRTNAFPDRVFFGVIDNTVSMVNEETRTVKVRAFVKNDDFLLRAGMFCKISVETGVSGEEALAVPQRALLSDEGKDFVFAKWKDGYFVRKPVKKGRDFFDSVEIIEGLKPGDLIVSEGAFLLKSDILREKMGAGCAD
ncbi:MAG: efflux RND transporter periplasmic adaptor subunit [Candidatus Latescibacterota bacterium]